jgi:hypothetical protein
MIDPRKVTRTAVVAKAKHVLHESECRRRYGSLWETKVLEGVVLECTLETKEGSTTGRRTAYINVSYDLGNKHYSKQLVQDHNRTGG